MIHGVAMGEFHGVQGMWFLSQCRCGAFGQLPSSTESWLEPTFRRVLMIGQYLYPR